MADAQGIDAHGGAGGSADVADAAAQLKSDGYSFVAQYIDQNDSAAAENSASPGFQQAADGPPGGSLAAADAQRIVAAGLKIVSIFETNGEAITPYEGTGAGNDYGEIVGYLSAAQGEADGKEAIASAQAIGQPTGSGIYFALDFDTGPPGYIPGLKSAVENYLAGVDDALKGSGYQIGVYGAAQTLQWATTADPSNGYTPDVTYTWLSGSSDWTGYGPTAGDPGNTEIAGPNGNTVTHGWTMIQTIPGDNNNDPGTAPGTSVGVDYDTAAGNEAYGAWPCYVTGTRILTDRGEIAVEDLAVGDRVVTVAGQHRPIAWIGHRALDITRHRDPALVWPVRVEAGAFGDNRPHRDLWLSPEHAVLVGGVLVQVGRLLNGATIAQVPRDHVTYWHIELDSHDLVWAEGLEAESFLDTGNRDAFAEGGGALQLHPRFAGTPGGAACMPLVETGPDLFAVKAALLRRAEALGYAWDGEDDLHVVVDGRRIEAAERGDGYRTFVLPDHGGPARLVSRTWRPVQATAAVEDYRALGVAVWRLRVDGTVLPLEEQGEGWHAFETDGTYAQRWTTGSTPLPAGTRVVTVDLNPRGRYLRDATNRRAEAA